MRKHKVFHVEGIVSLRRTATEPFIDEWVRDFANLLAKVSDCSGYGPAYRIDDWFDVIGESREGGAVIPLVDGYAKFFAEGLVGLYVEEVRDFLEWDNHFRLDSFRMWQTGWEWD